MPQFIVEAMAACLFGHAHSKWLQNLCQSAILLKISLIPYIQTGCLMRNGIRGGSTTRNDFAALVCPLDQIIRRLRMHHFCRWSVQFIKNFDPDMYYFAASKPCFDATYAEYRLCCENLSPAASRRLLTREWLEVFRGLSCQQKKSALKHEKNAFLLLFASFQRGQSHFFSDDRKQKNRTNNVFELSIYDEWWSEQSTALRFAAVGQRI